MLQFLLMQRKNARFFLSFFSSSIDVKNKNLLKDEYLDTSALNFALTRYVLLKYLTFKSFLMTAK